MQSREDSDHLDENIDEFEDLTLIDLLIDLILPDVVGHIEEGNQLEFQLITFQAKLNLHSFEGVRLDDQIDVLLKIALHDLHLHLLIISLTLPLTLCALLADLSFLLIDHLILDELLAFDFLGELDICDLLWCWWFLGEIVALDAEGPYHFDVEVLTQDDVVGEARFDFEVLLALLVHISKHEHAIGDFFLEERDLLFHTVPNGVLPLCVVLLFLLVVCHYFNKINKLWTTIFFY